MKDQEISNICETTNLLFQFHSMYGEFLLNGEDPIFENICKSLNFIPVFQNSIPVFPKVLSSDFLEETCLNCGIKNKDCICYAVGC